MVLDSWAKFIKMNRRVLMRELNPSLVCVLCKGYFIDATTIVECVHSFCRSCIVKHFESSKYCPICEVMVHKTRPLLSLKRDKTLQDIVYKLVPGLFENEMQQRRQYYQDRPHYVKPDDYESGGDVSEERKFSNADESIIVSLSYFQSDCKPWFVRCPVGVSISHIKKLITCKYGFDSSKVQVEIMLQSRILDPELTLLDIACLFPYGSKESLEFSFVMLELKTMTDEVGKETNLDTECTESERIESVGSKVVEKEVQLQITETGIMSVIDVDALLSDAHIMESVASSSIPTSTSITLTSTTPAQPTTASPIPSALPINKVGMKRASAEVRDLVDQKKAKRVEEIKPKRPSVGESEQRPKRASVEDKEVKRAVACEENGIRGNRSTGEVTTTRVEEKVKSIKRPSTEESDENAKRPLVQEHEKNVKLPTVMEDKKGKRPSVEEQEKKARTTTEALRRTRKPSNDNVAEAQKAHNFASSSNTPPTSIAPASNISQGQVDRLGEIKKVQEKGNEVKSEGVVASTSNSKNPTSLTVSQPSVRSIPAPSKKTPVPEASPKETSSGILAPEKGVTVTSSSNSPTNKSDTTAAQRSPKNKTLRSGPDPWRPVITKEKLRPTLMSNNTDEAKKPAKFFKMRQNAPRFLGNPASGVKPMYNNGMTSMSPPKTPPKKSEPIVRIDPKTLRPMEKEGKKSPSMIMTSPFIPRDHKIMLPDPKTQPFSALAPGYHASLPPSISMLLNPQQHFRNLKAREEAASKNCDTPEPKPSASGSAPPTTQPPSSSSVPTSSQSGQGNSQSSL